MTATAVGQRTGRLAEKVRRKSRSAAGTIRLELLGGFQLTRGTEVLVLSPGEQRLLAFLAVPNKPMQRTFVAGNLWLESSEQRAAGNLRSTLWRLRALDRTLVASTRSQLALGPAVSVDLHETSAHARDVLVHMHARPLSDAPMMVAGDLLPDWYDDWVVIERERFRQLRLHALEALCATLAAERLFGLAVEAGLACVAADPLRESAHRVLISAHIAEGNTAEALRQYRLFCKLSEVHLGAPPSDAIERLIAVLPVPAAAAIATGQTL